MDAKMLDKLVAMMSSDNDTDAVMGLRGLQGHFKEEGVDFSKAVTYALSHIDELKKQSVSFAALTTPAAAQVATPVALSGMPQCRAQGANVEIIIPGQTKGELVALSGVAAGEAAHIADHLKDALVAAAINKSRMKLKVVDIKNNKGEVVETVLQAEYEREGMTPIRVWSNVRGEVAALAVLLRKAVANALPELVAA